MNEKEWLACDHPLPMLSFLRRRGASARKLRLFACACCRRIADLLSPSSLPALEVGEGHADGWFGAEQLAEAEKAAREAAFEESALLRQTRWVAPEQYATSPSLRAVRWERHRALEAVADALSPLAWDAALAVPGWAEDARVGLAPWEMGYLPCPEERRRVVARLRGQRQQERDAQCALLRELFGVLPFRPGLVRPTWLAWADRSVVRLAQVIDERQSFDDLTVLADALEDAGCTDEALLNHCRAREGHRHGCWAVDALLGVA
jgi:hypothetical protein